MLSENDRRILDLANRLQDMTEGEWSRVKYLIDTRFEIKKREMERKLQLSCIKEDDIVY